jgi:outer membrane protein TolC
MHEALLHLSDAQLTLAVRLAYLALDHADRFVASSEAALTRVALTERDVQSLFQAGMADSVAILETRRAGNEARLQLKSAEIMRRQREIELVTLLGLDPEESLTLTSTPTEPNVNSVMYDGVSLDKPDLQAALAAVNMNRAMLSLSRSDYFPTVAVFGGWSYGKPNIDPFHNEFNDYLTVGATLNWSLNLGFKTGKNSASAKSQLLASEHEYDRVNEQLDRDARLSFESLRLAHEQYQISKQNRSIADDNYRLAQSQYRDGTLSSNRLLDIDAALTQAESSLAAARTNYHSAMSRYLYLIGSDKLKEGF